MPFITLGQNSATLKTTNASSGFQSLGIPTVGLVKTGNNTYNADTLNLLVSKQRGDSLAGAIKANSTIYNVLKFGAIGDGITDCTPFINAAINAASTNGGGIVDIPEGTFLIKAAYVTTDPYKPKGIILKSNVILQGHGASTILRLSNPPVASTFSGSNPSFTTNSVFSNIINGYRVTNSVVRDLSIDGNLSNQINTTLNPYTNPQSSDTLYSTSGIRFYLGSNNKVNNVTINSSAGYGVQFFSCPNSDVLNSTSYDAVNGGIGYFGASNYGTSMNNRVTRSYSDGYRIQSNDITVIGCYASWTRQNSNLMLANFAGFYLESVDRCKFINCYSSNNSSFGFDMNKNGISILGVLITGCTATQNRSAGMLISVNHALVSNNYIVDNGADSLGIKDTIPVGLYSRAGILVTASDSFGIFSNNTFLQGRGYQTYAFDNQGIYATYNGNVMYNHSGFFIFGNDWTKNASFNNISYNGTTMSYNNTGGIAGSAGDLISFTTANSPVAITAVASGLVLASQGTGIKPAYIRLPATTSGSGIPSSTPVMVGDTYIDIVNKKTYSATGISSSSDWTILN